MVKVTFKSRWTGEEETINILKTMYRSNNRVALAAETEMGEPYGVLTVNLESTLIAPDEIILDTNNMSEDLFEQLFKNGYLINTRRTARSGYCTYPIVKMTPKLLKELEM